MWEESQKTERERERESVIGGLRFKKEQELVWFFNTDWGVRSEMRRSVTHIYAGEEREGDFKEREGDVEEREMEWPDRTKVETNSFVPMWEAETCRFGFFSRIVFLPFVGKWRDCPRRLKPFSLLFFYFVLWVLVGKRARTGEIEWDPVLPDICLKSPSNLKVVLLGALETSSRVILKICNITWTIVQFLKPSNSWKYAKKSILSIHLDFGR